MISHDIFSTIQVPVDGSEPSYQPAEVGNTIGNSFNSEIILLYVVISPS